MASDFRSAGLPHESFDAIIAAAVLHHLRDDGDWRSACSKLYDLLRPGGSVWITDMVTHESRAVHRMMWSRYGGYLSGLNGTEYRDTVFACIDREDSPRPVTSCSNIQSIARIKTFPASSSCEMRWASHIFWIMFLFIPNANRLSPLFSSYNELETAPCLKGSGSRIHTVARGENGKEPVGADTDTLYESSS